MNRNVLAVLLAATALAGADTGEFLLDREVAYATAESDQLYPAAASNGTNSLVIWSDGRSGPTDIYGARFAPDGTVLDPAGIVISTAANGQTSPAVASDGANYLVAWADQRGGEQDIYGARVTPQGSVLDTFAVTTMQGDEFDPALARGPGNGILTAYSSWAGDVEEESYNSLRIWGTLSPHAGTNDRPTDVARTPRPAPTFVRGVLVLGAADSRQNTEYRAELLDVGGRKVLDLLPGPNDVRALAPGVYFVRNAQPQAQAQAQAVRKVVITR
jgi:hypothetical protein